MFTCQSQLYWTPLLLAKRQHLTMSQISLIKRSFHWWRVDTTKRASTDHHHYLHMLDTFLLMYTFTEVKFTIGVLVVTHRTHHSATDNANGWSQDWDLFHLMFQKVDTSNYAIVKCQQMLLSVIRLTKTFLDGIRSIIKDSLTFGEWVFIGEQSYIGFTHSISNLIWTPFLGECF